MVILLVALIGVLWAATNIQLTSGDRPTTPPTLEAPAPSLPAVVESEATATPSPATEDLPPIGTEVGNLAPDFTLETLKGQQSLSDFRGQVVMLNFWASWCGPCRVEMPDVQAVYEAYEAEGFVVLGVNIGETEQTVSEFVDQFDLSFPIMLDGKAQVARQFGAFSIPTSYFLDRDGVIQKIQRGAVPASFIEDVITPLLDAS
jgi:peroxiredoxin